MSLIPASLELKSPIDSHSKRKTASRSYPRSSKAVSAAGPKRRTSATSRIRAATQTSSELPM